ncbi:uncharacterized protein TNCV_1829291 [Trichonephila clavipes]|nr:uncharacterized protein TNCV_1829291 [Trichonephila clavipes]
MDAIHKNQMKHLAEIQIPRYLAEDATAKRVLLIGFCDASQRAYAAVFYLRTELVTGKVHVSMITSKTRVAPVKSITLPRLKLLAALLLSELYVVVLESLRKVIQIDKSFLFSDSQIVLDWLKSSPSRWKIFVANRISRIQKMTSEASWHQVKSQENPADCASRGIAASKLKVHKLWWSEPQWLSQDSLHFPSIDLSTSCEEDEIGPQLTLCCIRQKFWIPSGRGVVGRLLSKCQTCFRFKAKSGEQLMGNLPANRLSAGRAFLNVGIDFGGPFITKPNVSRSKVKLKSYLALFICMATKAVHLEVVSDLSADAFMAAFLRFISRRGKPTNMFSDNATNFKGASSYLKEQLKLIKSVEVQNFVTQESITWHFIPPTAAHIGGLWEAGIKSTKQLLIKTMKSAVLNFEELVTFVTQIEACLNSRPLTPLSNDPQDLQPLTPGHFLIGTPMASSRRGPFTTSVLKEAMEFNSTSPKSVLEEMAPGVPKSLTTKNQVE